jgi:hypothetical protein
MLFLRFAVMVLALGLLGAHFFRQGAIFLALPSLLLMPLVFYPSRWAVAPVQIWLALGTLEWLATLVVTVRGRMAEDAPWTRLAIILGGVLLFTAYAAVEPFFGTLRQWYVGDER